MTVDDHPKVANWFDIASNGAFFLLCASNYTGDYNFSFRKKGKTRYAKPDCANCKELKTLTKPHLANL